METKISLNGIRLLIADGFASLLAILDKNHPEFGSSLDSMQSIVEQLTELGIEYETMECKYRDGKRIDQIRISFAKKKDVGPATDTEEVKMPSYESASGNYRAKHEPAVRELEAQIAKAIEKEFVPGVPLAVTIDKMPNEYVKGRLIGIAADIGWNMAIKPSIGKDDGSGFLILTEAQKDEGAGSLESLRSMINRALGDHEGLRDLKDGLNQVLDNHRGEDLKDGPVRSMEEFLNKIGEVIAEV